MRIVTWNCAGKFREKASELLELNPDIFISEAWAENLAGFALGEPERWLPHSDHCPLTVDVSSVHTPKAWDKEADRKAIDAAFGIWADKDIDGLEYQLRMRAEWDRDEL